MKSSKIPLDQIQVASPCTASWNDMIGDERTRFCEHCSQHVYNLSEMTRKEAEALVLEREGKMCVRFYRRFDGTMLTVDCPVGWRAAAGRVALIGSAVAGVCFALLGLMTVGAFAATRADRNGRAGNPIQRVWELIFPPPDCVMGGIGPPPIAPPPPPAPPVPPPAPPVAPQ
ncbi:MAG TPA: hypothetical protein VFE62_14100 [Gemmataceae bacterium]|nr:hypothetical protein [Gemmataceae bacterium]